MNTSNNPAWERTKERVWIAVGSTALDALVCNDYTVQFLQRHLVENVKTIINNDDQAIPDLLKSLFD